MLAVTEAVKVALTDIVDMIDGDTLFDADGVGERVKDVV